MNRNERFSGYPCIIHSHATTWHDGGVAVLLPDGTIYALSSERVGDRCKHSWNSRLAYDYLRSSLRERGYGFGSKTDYFTDPRDGLERTGHHLYHAASAFFASPFDEAVILVVDGQGPEKGKSASTTIWRGLDKKLVLLESPYLTENAFASQSVGHFYTAIGALAGMQNLYEEGKTMGLAAYGKPYRFLEHLRHYAYSRPDGSYYIDPKFVLAVFGNTFGFHFYGWRKQPPEIQSIWVELLRLRKYPLRREREDITEDDINIAYAGQMITEEIIFGLTRRAKQLSGSNNICLSGGVALNSVINGRIDQSRMFNGIYVFPAPGDEGQAIGKLFHYIHSRKISIDTQIKTAFFGPDYSSEQIASAVEKYDKYVSIISSDKNLLPDTISRLVDGQIIGWFQGRSELGPRALGHRSILADPRTSGMRDRINFHVKGREWYRPLAPVILEERVREFFDTNHPNPFMATTVKVKPNKWALIPSAIHIDGSARLQTINENQDSRFYHLVKGFGKKTDLPILINTSFNKRNEPIVESPEDALEAFIDMNLDALVLNQYLIVKR